MTRGKHLGLSWAVTFSLSLAGRTAMELDASQVSWLSAQVDVLEVCTALRGLSSFSLLRLDKCLLVRWLWVIPWPSCPLAKDIPIRKQFVLFFFASFSLLPSGAPVPYPISSLFHMPANCSRGPRLLKQFQRKTGRSSQGPRRGAWGSEITGGQPRGPAGHTRQGVRSQTAGRL